MSRITKSLIAEATRVLSGQTLVEGVSFFTDDLIDALARSLKKSSSAALVTKTANEVTNHINKTIKPKTSEGKFLVKSILTSLQDLTKAVKEYSSNDFKDALKWGWLDSYVEDAIENLRKLDRVLQKDGIDLEGLPRFYR